MVQSIRRDDVRPDGRIELLVRRKSGRELLQDDAVIGVERARLECPLTDLDA
jgi:hypothetical protein